MTRTKKSADSPMWNPQMRKVYLAMLAIGAGTTAIGAAAKGFAGVRDGSMAFGDINDSLRLLADKNEYLKSVAGSGVVLPSKAKDRKPKTEEQMRLLAEEPEELGLSKAADIFQSFRDLSHPIQTFTGMNNPNAEIWEIPAFWPGTLLAGTTGLHLGSKLMGGRMKNKAKAKLKKEQAKAKQEFEAALIYEQEEARKRIKRGSETSELIEAVDELFSAVDRYETMTKTADGLSAGGMLVGAAGLLALLAGYTGYNRGYSAKKNEKLHEEKSKLVGANTSYEDVLKNLEARSIDADNLRLSTVEAPTFTTTYVQ